jgi:ATPase family AAA domain-containing protein 3A/B
MSGGDLIKSRNVDHVTAFEQLMTCINGLTSPTVVFIDEAEVFCGARDKKAVDSFSPLFNAFLAQTGKASSKIMFILATNRLGDIDSALRARMAHQIFIGSPELAQRVEIIKTNMDMIFKQEQSGNFFAKEIIDYIANKTDGYAGRDIFQFLNRLQGARKGSEAITQEMIDEQFRTIARQQEIAKAQG